VIFWSGAPESGLRAWAQERKPREAVIRDLLLLAILFGIVPMIVRTPFVGLLAWIWVSLMNPNREVHGFLQGAPLNLYLAALTAIAWLASRDRKAITPNAFTILLMVFACWATLSTYFALDREHAQPLWERTMKTVILTLAVTILANTRVRMQAVVWTIAVSLGYYAVKGGGFTLLGGGHSHVFGPENTMIEDNNALGLALIVLLPLLNYLRLTSARALTRAGLLAAIGLTVVAILGTYSRGALVALGAAGLIYSLRSRQGPLILVAAVLAALVLPSVMPENWLERMSSIQAVGDDDSFQGRLAAWRTSFNIAAARPLLGGGFVAVEQTRVVQLFSSPGSLTRGRAAHSVYFQVLGETGFAGLLIYLSMVGAAVVNTFRVLGIARGRPDLAWTSQLARMLQVSICAFLAGGAALSMAYYDGVLMVFALTAALLQIARQPREGELEVQPAWRRSSPHPTVAGPLG